MIPPFDPVIITEQLHYFEGVSYLGILVAIILSGHVIPVPEDVIMFIAGYLSATNVLNLGLAITFCIAGVLLVDMSLYYLSFTGSKFAGSFGKKIKTHIFSWYTGNMKKRTFRVVFISRFIPGLRMVSPVVAGFSKIPPLKFFTYALVAACAYAPITVLIGFFLHSHITPLITMVETTRHALFVIFLVAVGVSITLFVRKKFFT